MQFRKLDLDIFHHLFKYFLYKMRGIKMYDINQMRIPGMEEFKNRFSLVKDKNKFIVSRAFFRY